MNILQTSCVKPSIEGGIANVEYNTIAGLRAEGHKVDELFPYYKSAALSDLYYGFKNMGLANKYDVVHAHTNMNWLMYPVVRTFHGCTALGMTIAELEKDNVLKGGIYLNVNRYLESMAADTAYCIGVSDYTTDAIRNYYGVEREMSRTVYNGIDTDKFFPCKSCGIEMREENQIPQDVFVVTWTGHFEFNKGIKYMLEVAHHLEDHKDILFFVRSSVKASDIPSQYKYLLKKENIKYIPHGTDMPDFYNSGDVHLLTSTYDPMPLTILEAMACGKPVIVTTAGGHAEVVEHGTSGFVEKYFDTFAMAEDILDLKEHDAKRIKMGKAARKRIEEKFTIKHMIENTLNAYKISTLVDDLNV